MSTRVIIPQRLCTSKTLQQWIRRKYHVLNLLDATILASRYRGDILHNPFGSFGLSGTRFTRDDNALVLVVGIHVIVGRFGDSKHVWRDF